MRKAWLFDLEQIEKATLDLRKMDELSRQDSFVHRLHPLTKLVVTFSYIIITASFDKYDFYGLFVLILYPVLGYMVSGIAMRTCLYRMRFVLPVVAFVGLFNPFFDKGVVGQLGDVVITGGLISFATLMLKGVLCLMASFLLIATTSIDSMCCALRRIHVPDLLVTLLLLTYRYVFTMLDEVSVLTIAYKLRAPGQKGIHFSAWGSFLGQLLLRSMDKAEELYQGMILRGFHGEFFYADVKKATWIDWLCTVGFVAVFVLCRVVRVTQLLGNLVL